MKNFWSLPIIVTPKVFFFQFFPYLCLFFLLAVRPEERNIEFVEERERKRERERERERGRRELERVKVVNSSLAFFRVRHSNSVNAGDNQQKFLPRKRNSQSANPRSVQTKASLESKKKVVK